MDIKQALVDASIQAFNQGLEHGRIEQDTDLVNHPPHYTSHPSGIEAIQVTRHMNFNLGNAIKYIWRAGLKGDGIQDLQKAIFYLQDEIERLR